MNGMTAGREPDEDDGLIEDLPELGDLAEEEPLGVDEPPGADELGLDADGEERIGLDDSTGVEDEAGLYALDLPPDDEVGDEDDVDAIPIEGLDGEDEYGWADTGKERDEPLDVDEIDLVEPAPIGGEDHGEEGVEEALDFAGVSGDEVPHLPPMSDSPDDDEDAEDLAIGEDAIIEAAVLDYEAERRQMGRSLPPRLEPPACVVEHLGPGAPIFALAPGPPLLAGGAGLFRVGDRAEPLATQGLDDVEVIAVALDASDPRRMVVGTRASGALRSIDGASFAPANAWAGEGRDVAQSFVVRLEKRARLWGCSASGALFRSDDFGASWAGPLLLKPVVALATPPDGGVVALCAGRDAPAQIARSEDGGQRWTAVDGPPLAPGAGELFLAVLRDAIAVSADEDPEGPFLSTDRGKTWTRMPGLPPTGAMALAWEPGGLTLYAAHFFESEDRGVVVRHRPGGGEGAVVLDVAREATARGVAPSGDPEGDHRVYAIDARCEGERTLLHVATGAGLFRVRIDPGRP
ncbi:MAG TPA: sialidase family protein [Sandaracinaceae bacterium]